MNLLVMKFGGTSVENADAMRRVAAIVRSSPARQTVVFLSACAGVTNTLLRIGTEAARGAADDAAALVEEIGDHHRSLVHDLLPPPARPEVLGRIDAWMGELHSLVRGISILGELTPRSMDILASYGERLSSGVFEAFARSTGMPTSLVDARTFLITDDHYTRAVPDIAQTRRRLHETVVPLLTEGRVVVTQGFIGSTPEGITTTIGRGGSDHSAAIAGAILGADEIQIWTDVDGILTADPSIVPDARRIRIMSFREASELAYFGARVLHPETILPAIEKEIPVRVLNSRRPDSAGTQIVAQPHTTQHCIVKSVAYKEGIILIGIVSTRMFLAHGFLENIFDVFHKYRTVVHTVASSDVSVSVTINDGTHLAAIVSELERFATVTVDRPKAIVCVVGDNLRNSAGIAARVLKSITHVNINMISQGASEINISFVIDEECVDTAVAALHTEFFSTADLYKEIFD